MRNTILSILSILSILFLVSCDLSNPMGAGSEGSNDFGRSNPAILERVVVDGGATSVDLLAGQYIDAGNVTVDVVDNDLVVTYTTENDYYLLETHLWVGEDLADMPQTRKGNPKIGNFPYNSGDISGATSYTVTRPLSEFGLDMSMDVCDPVNLYIAAHAVVGLSDGNGGYTDTETGWADGDNFVSRGSWATFFTLTLTCEAGDDDPPVVVDCETAFAYDGTGAGSFLLIDEDGDGTFDFNRWGWTIGPLTAGNYTYDIYAGAGQSDITKGTLVGELTVDYDGSNYTVTFSTFSGFSMDENHLYVGNEILPRDVNGELTVAPGQYPTIHDDLNSASFDSYFGSASGDIYVVAHAVVCGAY